MRKYLGASAFVLAAMLAMPSPGAAKDEPKTEAAAKAPAIPPAMVALEKGLHKQTGDVRIPEAKAVLHLGENYYFIPAAEAKRVLTEVWGNPPEAVSNTLGLVIDRDHSIFNSVWGAIITYEESGHVSDADAKAQDYGTVLKDMQQSQQSANPERVKAGYPEMRLVGWAQPPSYDAASHSLVWARELSVGGDPDHGLNYDVRLLGRTGVLSLNMLASMASLDDVKGAAASFGKAVTFEPGAGYDDFDASTDKAAEYGLAGLVAGGAAVAVASKLGFLAVILKFAKLIILGVVALGAGAWAAVKRFFGPRNPEVI